MAKLRSAAMTFRPTTLERAYQLAEGGDCATISEIKLRLQSEGFTNIQDQLFGLSTARALRERCKPASALGRKAMLS
jgi:hypothetical protein